MLKSWARLPVSFIVAVVVTFALFLFMHRLVALAGAALNETDSLGAIDFVRLKRESATRKKERALPDKPQKQQQPKTPKMQMPNTGPAEGTAVSVATPDIDTGLDMGGLTKGVQGDTEAVPIVRVEPIYPRNAAQMQLEGWVTLKFDIGPSGQVLNPKVIAAEPARIFDRAALNAVKKWKYKPQFQDGKPTTTRGQTVRLTFRLEN